MFRPRLAYLGIWRGMEGSSPKAQPPISNAISSIRQSLCTNKTFAHLTPTNRPLLRPLVQQNPRPTIPHPRPHHPPAGALFKSTIQNQQSSIGNPESSIGDPPRSSTPETILSLHASPLARPHPQSLGSRPTLMPVLQSSHETRRCRQTPGANRIFSASPRFVGRHHPAPSPATASFRHRDDGT